MPKKRFVSGVIDPITIIGVLFLIITLGVGTFVISDKRFNFNIFEKARIIECFPAGTKISTADGGTKNIEDFVVGDKVKSENITSGQKRTSTTTKLWKLFSFNMCSVDFESGEKLKLTNPHPLYTKEGWKAINVKSALEHNPELTITELTESDSVKKQDGSWDKITDISCEYGLFRVYNLAVDTDNNYFAERFLAHNKGGGPGIIVPQDEIVIYDEVEEEIIEPDEEDSGGNDSEPEAPPPAQPPQQPQAPPATGGSCTRLCLQNASIDECLCTPTQLQSLGSIVPASAYHDDDGSAGNDGLYVSNGVQVTVPGGIADTPTSPARPPAPVVTTGKCVGLNADYEVGAIAVFAGEGSYKKCVVENGVVRWTDCPVDEDHPECRLANVTNAPVYLQEEQNLDLIEQHNEEIILQQQANQGYITPEELDLITQQQQELNRTANSAKTGSSTPEKEVIIQKPTFDSKLSSGTKSVSQYTTLTSQLPSIDWNSIILNTPGMGWYKTLNDAQTNYYNSRPITTTPLNLPKTTNTQTNQFSQFQNLSFNDIYDIYKIGSTIKGSIGNKIADTILTPLVDNYLTTFSNPNNNFVWQQQGYQSSEEAIQDCVDKNGIGSAYGCMKQMTALGKDQVTSTINLGTRTAELITLPFAPAIMGTESLLALGLGTFGSTMTVEQTKNAVIADINDQEDTAYQYGMAFLSWANIGTANYIMKAWGPTGTAIMQQNARVANTVVSGVNLAVDAPYAYNTCTAEDSSFGDCAFAGGVLATDLIFGGVDYFQNQLTLNPIRAVTETIDSIAPSLVNVNRLATNPLNEFNIPRNNSNIPTGFIQDVSPLTNAPIIRTDIQPEMNFSLSGPGLPVTQINSASEITTRLLQDVRITDIEIGPRTDFSPNAFNTSDPLLNITRPISNFMDGVTRPVADLIAENVARPLVPLVDRFIHGIDPNAPTTTTIVRNEPNMLFAPRENPVTNQGYLRNLVDRTIGDTVSNITASLPTNAISDIFPPTRLANTPTTPLATRIWNGAVDGLGNLLNPLATRLGLDIQVENLRFTDQAIEGRYPFKYPASSLNRAEAAEIEFGNLDDHFLLDFGLKKDNLSIIERDAPGLTELDIAAIDYANSKGITVFKVTAPSENGITFPDGHGNMAVFGNDNYADFPLHINSITLNEDAFGRKHIGAIIAHEIGHLKGQQIPDARTRSQIAWNEIQAERFALAELKQHPEIDNPVAQISIRAGLQSDMIYYRKVREIEDQKYPWQKEQFESNPGIARIEEVQGEIREIIPTQYEIEDLNSMPAPPPTGFWDGVRTWWQQNIGDLNFRGLGNDQVTTPRSPDTNNMFDNIISWFNRVGQPDLTNQEITNVARLTPDEDLIISPSLLENNIGKAEPKFTKTDSTISQELPAVSRGVNRVTQDSINFDLPDPIKISKSFSPYTYIVGGSFALLPALAFLDDYYDLGIQDSIFGQFGGSSEDKSIGAKIIVQTIIQQKPILQTAAPDTVSIEKTSTRTLEAPELNLNLPPEGLTINSANKDGKCVRIDRSNPCDGARMYELYLWYKEQPNAWWNDDGDFTPADFLALMLLSEAKGADPEFLKSIMVATSNQLWGEGNPAAPNGISYCTTPECEAGIFNFIGAYMEVASRRYNTIIIDKNTQDIDLLIKSDSQNANIFAKNGLTIDKIAIDTIINPISTTYSNDAPTHWGNFGCGQNCDYLGDNWLQNAGANDIKVNTDDRCGVYDIYGQNGVSAVVYTNNQAYNWSLPDSPCFTN